MTLFGPRYRSDTMISLSLCWLCIIKIFWLLLLANGTPIIARDLLKNIASWPLDFGYRFVDGRPLLGYSKTWRGLLLSMLVCGAIAPFLGFSVALAIQFSLLSLLGDLLASFYKRRLGLAESSRFRILDIFPESLLPLIVLYDSLAINALEAAIVVLLFFLTEIYLSPILYKLHIRKRPY